MLPQVIDYWSAKNGALDKPNEDFVLVDQESSVFIVADGITRTRSRSGAYPDPSPASRAARRFSQAVHEAIIEDPQCRQGDATELLRVAFAAGNAAVAELNSSLFEVLDFFENDRAGLAAIVGLVQGTRLYIGAVGDCACHWYHNGQISCLNAIQTKHLESTYPEPRSEELIQFVRTFRNNPNHELGYGAITGEDAALAFVEYTHLDLSTPMTVYLHSDGVQPYFDYFPVNGQQRSLAEIDEIVCSHCNQHSLRLDDRTIICLQF